MFKWLQAAQGEKGSAMTTITNGNTQTTQEVMDSNDLLQVDFGGKLSVDAAVSDPAVLFNAATNGATITTTA
jgi:hypothetical protein